ncbi:trypsin-like peptidase domain-containing protein [Candidatus Odyssella acanthamoebae]|uniref:trypsin-like peptidase domain-containing protein n=1 Tax=Candidatus Odyssella acanthamoebae TaxID=91604 RepID=UPI00068E5A76|nr:trypsin-like peptidase domain-containing protein [Candidatus Paracaedibacter acanthamoebae]
MYQITCFIVALFYGFCVQADSSKTPASLEEIKLSFSPIVKKVAPAVVSIYTVHVTERPLHPLFDDDFLNNFLDYSQAPLRQELSKSMGSGVIISPDGTVITCAHVVQNAKAIEIRLSDNRQLKGKVTIIDPKNDLAVIKILDFEGDIPFVPLGQSSTVEDGDLVLAFGNPFGIGHTVTSGIISAVTRTVGDRVLMQTDSAINPGNSGGALVNMKGELIGIPNAILSRTGTNLGIGFAIPIAIITPLLSAKTEDGTLSRAWDGLKVETLDHDKAESFGLKNQKGVLVSAIHPSSPAKTAGLQVSDVIININEHPIASEEAYRLKLLEIEIDKEIRYAIKRKGADKTITFKVIAPPDNPKAEETVIQGRNPLSGIKIANLSPALALKYGFDSLQIGVIILDVPVRSSLFGIPIFQSGDIIEEADGKKVESVKQFTTLLKDSLNRLTLRQGNKRIDLHLTNR